jgi:hypothetical protein
LDPGLTGTEGGADGNSRNREAMAGAGAKRGRRLFGSIVPPSCPRSEVVDGDRPEGLYDDRTPGSLKSASESK